MRQGPSFETSTPPVEEDFEIVRDVMELSADEVGEEIQKLLAGKEKIKSVENFALKGVHNQMDLEADIDADFVGSFGLKASIKSDGTSIRIGDIDVVAGALKKMAIKKFINSELPTLIPKITDYLSTKYGKSVTGLSIEDGKLKVRFPDEKKKVEKNVAVEDPVPQVAGVAPVAKESQPLTHNEGEANEEKIARFTQQIKDAQTYEALYAVTVSDLGGEFGINKYGTIRDKVEEVRGAMRFPIKRPGKYEAYLEEVRQMIENYLPDGRISTKYGLEDKVKEFLWDEFGAPYETKRESEPVTTGVHDGLTEPVAVGVGSSEPVPPVEESSEAPHENPLAPEDSFFEDFFNKREGNLDEVEAWIRERQEEIRKGGKIKGPKKTTALRNLDKLQVTLSFLRGLKKNQEIDRDKRRIAVRALKYLFGVGAIVIPGGAEEVAAGDEAVEAGEVPAASAPDMENGVTASTGAAGEAPGAAADPKEGTTESVEKKASPGVMVEAVHVVGKIPEKEKPSFLRGVMASGYAAREMKSQVFASIFENLGPSTEKIAEQLGKKKEDGKEDERRADVIAKQDSSWGKLMRGFSKEYRKEGRAAEKQKESVYTKGGIMKSVLGARHIAQLGLLASRPFVQGIEALNPMRTAGMGALFLGRGLNALKEAQLDSYERIEKNRLSEDEALDAAESMLERFKQEGLDVSEGKNISAAHYEGDRFSALVVELQDRLGAKMKSPLKTGEFSALGFTENMARRGIQRSLESLSKKLEKVGGDAVGKEKLMRKWKEYVDDMERIVEQGGAIDLSAYATRAAEKGTKKAATILTVEALVNLCVSGFDAFDHFAQDRPDVPRAGGGGALNLPEGSKEVASSEIEYKWSGMTTDSMHASEPNPLIPEGFLSGHGTDESSIDSISTHESGVVLPKEEVVFDEAPEAALLKIGKRGPEGSIIDYFKEHQDVAKKFGWDGNGDIKKWAGTKAHALWLEHASKALENDGVKESLTKLGYTNDLEGYTKMMSRIKSGGVALDIQHEGVTLSNMEYLEAKTSVPVKLEAIEKIGFEPAPFEDIQSAVSVESEVKETLESDVASGADIETSPDVIESESAQGEVDDGQSWETREPALYEAPAEALDTRGKSVSDAVMARMNRDLTEVFGTNDEAHSEWPQWRDYGARRFMNRLFDPESVPEGGHAVDLQNYLKDLEARSGVRPRARIFWFNQTVDEYIRLALKTIEQKSRS